MSNLGIGGISCYSLYGLARRFPMVGKCLVGANASTEYVGQGSPGCQTTVADPTII